MTRRQALFAVSAALLLLNSSPHAQAPAGSSEPQGPPAVTFQLEVSYVDVDAVVTDAQGHVVANLTRDDFELLEDGKPQKIEMFSSVDLPVVPAERFQRGRTTSRNCRWAPT